MNREPVLTQAGIVGAIEALLVLVVVMGWVDLSSEQQGAILAFVMAMVPIAGGVWARARVTPMDNAN